ncbi:MAG: hypothetical protein M0D55_00045 [Elusimicrobiota bacterium]|nr:MAG: hypothetical protein M0D55_00045 [Elusimicrobiota bacterium]
MGTAAGAGSGRAGPGWKALPSGCSSQKPHHVHGFSKASKRWSASSRVMRSLCSARRRHLRSSVDLILS